MRAASRLREASDSFGDLIEGLRAHGVAVRDHFLTAAQVRALAGCASARREQGGFAQARIGAALQRRPDIRGDSICWLMEPLFPAERELLGRFEALRVGINRRLFLGLADWEAHYACYPAGAAYARHVDQPRGSDARVVSTVLYLNERWSEGDGGALVCLDDAGAPREIAPAGGRLVVFLTEGREHEVTPAVRERLSVAGWFRRRPGALLR